MDQEDRPIIPRDGAPGLLALRWAVLLLGLAAAACSQSPGSALSRLSDRGRLLTDGPSARMTRAAIEETRRNEVSQLYAFAVDANELTDIPGSTVAMQHQALRSVRDWGRVTQAGEDYIDTQCRTFVALLHDVERERRATLSGLNALQSATVGIMGLASAAQNAIGIVGLSFGLASSLFDVTVSAVLYDLPAASVAGVVQAQRAVLRVGDAAILARIDSQGAARARLSEYVLYCSPVIIEANIAKLLANTRAKNAAGLFVDDTPAAVVSSTVVGNGLSDSSGSRALRAFADAPGMTEAERTAAQRAIRDAARREGMGEIVVGSFLRDDTPDGQAKAERVARRLQLIP